MSVLVSPGQCQAELRTPLSKNFQSIQGSEQNSSEIYVASAFPICAGKMFITSLGGRGFVSGHIQSWSGIIPAFIDNL